jgi:hypothetical protein
MKSHAPVWPDGVFPQLRSGTTRAVENDEDLAALRRDLDAEAGIARVTTSELKVGSASIALLVNLIRGMEGITC